MDLAEIKGRRRTGNKRDGWLIKDADYQWLIAEVERLTTRNAKLETDLAGELALSTRLNEAWVHLNKCVYEDEIALSRAEGKREGLEAAAKIADRSARMSRTTSKAYAPETQGRNIFESRERLALDIAAAIREAAQEKKE